MPVAESEDSNNDIVVNRVLCRRHSGDSGFVSMFTYVMLYTIFSLFSHQSSSAIQFSQE